MTATTQQDSTTDSTATEADEAPVTYEKGSWQEQMQRSATLLDRSAKARKTASNLLWTGAKDAIEDWVPRSDSDVSGEGLGAEVLKVLGKARKGDASKIKTVALAVKGHGLVLKVHPNLAKAYAEAVRLTKTEQAEVEEDDAAEKAIEAIADKVPASTTTPEGAALILLSKGVDGAVVAILDALGKDDEAAHRSFMRAVSTEIAARVQAKKPKPVKKAAAADKGDVKVAKKAAPAKPKDGAAKAKPKPGAKAKPVAAKKAAPVKAEQPKPEQADSQPESTEGEQVSTPEVPVAQKKGAPVVIQR